jgi:hypothetical protein
MKPTGNSHWDNGRGIITPLYQGSDTSYTLQNYLLQDKDKAAEFRLYGGLYMY